MLTCSGAVTSDGLDPTTLSGYAFYFDTDFNLGALILQGGVAVADESLDVGPCGVGRGRRCTTSSVGTQKSRSP